jgi:hypothetical protein
MNVKDSLEITLLVGSIVTAIFKFAHLEHRIYEKITGVDNKLQLHITECAGDREMFEYRLNGLNEKIDHKANRFWDEFKALKAWVQKSCPLPE